MSRKPNRKAPAKKSVPESSGGLISDAVRGFVARTSERSLVFYICLLLALITAAVFGGTVRYNFIPYDDGAYVYDNPDVVRGLSLRTVHWAFTHSDLYLWTPLTTISHMLDCQVYGLRPGGHHLTNVLLHIATVIALFLALRQMSGSRWPSAFVAAVFAIHPLRVESVAWIAERKDVLSGLFFMLTLGAYVHYVRKRSIPRYLAVMVLFALGIMAKQMVVTLPCVLLLLDYWPLDRFAPPRISVFFRLVAEKIPLFALTAASCWQSFAERNSVATAVPGLHQFSWLRIENALVSYIIYIGKMFFPVKLAVYYPYPESIPAWQALGALALLAGTSIAAFAMRKSHPAFFTGWFWYLGMMVPVIGFVPLGKEGHADRYTYLPQIGLAIAIAWEAAAFSAKWRHRGEILSFAAALTLAVLTSLAAAQALYWRNGVTLWEHALSCTPDNGIARNFLGYALYKDNRLDEAVVEFKKSIALKPNYAEPENNLGIILLQEGEVDRAIDHFNRALEIDRGNVEARNNLALALIKKKKFDEAIQQLQIVLRLKPRRPDSYNNLGLALLDKGDVDGAMAQFLRALDLKPDYADGHANLANALLEKGAAREAAAQYQKSLDIRPENVPVQLNMARLLATCEDASVRDGNKAVALASQANELSGGDNPAVLDILAAAYADEGRFEDAIETSRRALEFATAAGDTEMVNKLQAHLALYRANTPLRIPLAHPPGR